MEILTHKIQRDQLRRVIFRTKYEQHHNEYPNKGWFHGWCDTQGDLPKAIVENERGNVMTIQAFDLQFVDK